MKPIQIHTSVKRMLADVYTPVGIYLRVRDRFRDTILLESADHHSASNSYSFICINAIAGIEIRDKEKIEQKYPGQRPETIPISKTSEVPAILWNFMNQFECRTVPDKEAAFAQGLYGYTSYDAVRFFDTVDLDTSAKLQNDTTGTSIPLMRYRLYQYVIAIDHFRD